MFPGTALSNLLCLSFPSSRFFFLLSKQQNKRQRKKEYIYIYIYIYAKFLFFSVFSSFFTINVNSLVSVFYKHGDKHNGSSKKKVELLVCFFFLTSYFSVFFFVCLFSLLPRAFYTSIDICKIKRNRVYTHRYTHIHLYGHSRKPKAQLLVLFCSLGICICHHLLFSLASCVQCLEKRSTCSHSAPPHRRV